MENHYALLKSLYELYKTNRNNADTLIQIGNIAWALEFDLGFDKQGYHELAELTKTPLEDKVSIQHYTKVIEDSLSMLQK